MWIMKLKKKHFINNNSIENKDKDKKQNNEDVNSAKTHRYYRINQFNNKKFRLKAPKNYINWFSYNVKCLYQYGI